MTANEVTSQIGNAFAGKDILSIIVMLVIIGAVGSFCIKGVRKISSYIGLVIAGMFLLEMFHIAAYYTDLGSVLPFTKTIFAFDVIGAIGTAFGGTKFADLCVRFEAQLIVAIQGTVGLIMQAYNMIMPNIKDAFSQ